MASTQQKLADKTAIVTGGSRGIGKAVSLLFLKEGARVVIADKDITGVQKTTGEFKEKGFKCLFVKVDVTKIEEVDKMVKTTVEQFGRVDVIVNCAGIISIARVTELEEKEWDDIMEVNAKGTFLCCQAVAKQMVKQRDGKIINISSMMGKMGAPRFAHYCASKFAVIGFTQSLAFELAPFRVNVNAICPGPIETDMQKWEWEWDVKTRGISMAEVKKETLSLIPWDRMGTPEDVAKMSVFLASEDADFVTGQAISVDGGSVMC